MEDLQHIIDALIKQHGWAAVQAAVSNNISKESGTTPTCPPGYYWDGSACVLNVG